MASQGIDSRISELRDFISYFAPGNIVEYGSFIHKKQPFRNYFEESRFTNPSRNSGYRPYEKGYDRRYEPTRDKKPRHPSCFNSSRESTPEDASDSPRSASESISSPDSNPNPTPRDTDPLPLSPNLDVVKMQLEALSRIPSPIDDTLPPADGFKLNQAGINKAFKDIVSLEKSPRVHVGGKTIHPHVGGKSRGNSPPRGMLGGKGLPITSHQVRPSQGGKGTVRAVTSGKQIPYHGLQMSLSSEDESDSSVGSDSDTSTDSSDEEISVGTIPLGDKPVSASKGAFKLAQSSSLQEEEEDTIVVDDLDIETEETKPSSITQRIGGANAYAKKPVVQSYPKSEIMSVSNPIRQVGKSKRKISSDMIVMDDQSVASHPVLSTAMPQESSRKRLIVSLKLPTVKQPRPHKSLIVKLQIPAPSDCIDSKKRPISLDKRQLSSISFKKAHRPESAIKHNKLNSVSSANDVKSMPLDNKTSSRTLSHKQRAVQMKLEAERLFEKGDGYQERAVAIQTHSLFHQILCFCELEHNKETFEAACDIAHEIRMNVGDVIEQHVSCGNLGIAGLLMKIESILTFRILNLQSSLIKTKTVEMKSQNPRISTNYLNTVQKFTEDFQSVTKKWHDAEAFLSRDPVLIPTTRDSLSLFTSLSHIVEVTKTVVPL
ncbi:hypothetical protein K7432_007665 [Basidiobolus ranarum]|uniref:Uncharacterized protein n=1 Tax=Basidiobolus ranarum TaxID=34480 RepID=A0ABR2WT31_9FUNG